MLSFAWPDAYEKAQYCAEVIMKKMARRGMKADDVHISYIGVNSLHLGVADMSEEALKNLNECVLRIAVFSEDKSECAKIIPGNQSAAVERTARSVLLRRTCAGTGGYGVVADYDSERCTGYSVSHTGGIDDAGNLFPDDIAHGRSGDKGDTSNVCVYARKPEYYKIIAAGS